MAERTRRVAQSLKTACSDELKTLPYDLPSIDDADDANGGERGWIDHDLCAEVAVMYNPLGAGFAWGVNTPQLQAGDRITILGCGQRGLCAVIAAREAGAGQILITGLAKDEYERAIQTLAGAFPDEQSCAHRHRAQTLTNAASGKAFAFGASIRDGRVA